MQKSWSNKISLQMRMIGSFMLMAAIVFMVGLMGQIGVNEIAAHFKEVADVRLPSIIGLELMSNGLQEAYSAELSLLNPKLNKEVKKNQLVVIREAQISMKKGREKYEPLDRTVKEDELWRKFLDNWQMWEVEHENFINLYRQFDAFDVLDPDRQELELLKSRKSNRVSAALEKIQAAKLLLNRMNEQNFSINKPIFNATALNLQAVIEENERIADQANKDADREIENIRFWTWLGMIAGVIISIGLGIVLSTAIAKPLDRNVKQVISQIASSVNEIAATLEQQERIAMQQVTSVNETTTTMEELGAASRRSSEQAELTAVGANTALNLATEGNQVVTKTLIEMEDIKQQVSKLGENIVHLSNTTNEIGLISKVVGDLANQTNMLALNAAVEAVRAGEMGKGFGVVATEIRKLAEESKTSVHKINRLVNDIQVAINSTVMVADQGTKSVYGGVQQVEKMATSFSGVSEAVKDAVLNSQQISLIAQQQAMAIRQVLEAMSNINNGSQQSATGISQARLGTQQLNEVVTNLKTLV